jgi:hypothetical protein
MGDLVADVARKVLVDFYMIVLFKFVAYGTTNRKIPASLASVGSCSTLI